MSDYTDGDYIFDTQWLALKRAIEGNAIFSGLGPSVVSGMTTRLATGSYYAGATKVTVAAPVDFVHSAADATYDRWDLIWGTSIAQGKTEGVATVAPVPPDLPAGAILLYMVRVRAGIVTILTGDLYEFGFSSSLLEHATRHAFGGIDVITPASIQAEPQFSKGTAFNKDFGTGIANIPAIGATLGNSQVVETDGTGKLISAVKGTADNKNFGTGTTNIPAIGATLGNSQVVETDATGKLISAAMASAFNKAFETTSSNIKMNGVQAIGSSGKPAHSDHVHPTDSSRAPTNHASAATTYGVGSSSVFGHVKMGSSIDAVAGVIDVATITRAIEIPPGSIKTSSTTFYTGGANLQCGWTMITGDVVYIQIPRPKDYSGGSVMLQMKGFSVGSAFTSTYALSYIDRADNVAWNNTVGKVSANHNWNEASAFRISFDVARDIGAFAGDYTKSVLISFTTIATTLVLSTITLSYTATR